MKNARIVLAGLISAILAASAATAQAETLQEAVKFMVESNPEIRSLSYNRIARNQEIRQAKAGYLPTIDAYVGAGLDRQHHPEFDTIWPQSATIGLRQNVFRFFGNESEINRQEARANSQAFLIQGSAQNNALLAAKSYLSVLRNEELFALAKENLINHQRIFDQVKLRSESGIDRKADLDQVMGRLALAQSNIVAAKANLEDSNSDYQAVIGHLPGILTRPESAAAALPATLEEAEKLAVDNHPTLMSSKLDIDARYAQHRTAKSQVYPSFDIAVDYKWQKDVDIAGRKEDFLAIASVSFNIFNGGWNRARIGQTSVEISEAREIFENVKRQAIHSVRLSWEANKAATDRIAFLEEYVKSAGATAEAFNAQWNIGRRTMFDLLDTQAEHINAKASLVTAKYDKLYAEYRVLNGTARLMQFLNVPLPGNSLVSIDQ